jgi:hypothetical protein
MTSTTELTVRGLLTGRLESNDVHLVPLVDRPPVGAITLAVDDGPVASGVVRDVYPVFDLDLFEDETDRDGIADISVYVEGPGLVLSYVFEMPARFVDISHMREHADWDRAKFCAVIELAETVIDLSDQKARIRSNP